MIKLLSKYLFLCLLLALIPIGAFSVLAVSPSSINVDVAPPNPAPNDNVTITLSSYAANLDSVSISWFVNGKNVLSGVGKKTLSVTAGRAGSRTQILAQIALPDGEIDKNVTIAPSVMVLLWQAEGSYVPPFYKGKALIAEEGDVKVVAIPEIKISGTNVSPKNMTYVWQKDYTNVADAGGYGKNFFSFTNDYLDSSNNIAVTSTTIDQQYSTTANIDVGITAPKIDLYKNDSNLGTIWEHTLPDTYNIQNSETVLAVPYFISAINIHIPSLKFSWFINDLAVSISSTNYLKNLLPLKLVPGTSGVSKFRVEVENTDKLLQKAVKEINVQF